MRTYRRHVLVTGAIASLALMLAACGGAGMEGGQTQAAPPPAQDQPAPGAASDGRTTAQDVFGPGCAQVPTDPAFDAIPPDQSQALLSDPAQKEKLTGILTYHVVPKRLTAEGLALTRTVDTVQGGKVTIEDSGDQIKVNGANVLCGNVPTANATVFVIDKVLMPSM